MNLKYLYGSIVMLFIAIVFFVPLGSEDSKPTKIVEEVVKTTKSIIEPKKSPIPDKEKYSEENLRKHNTVLIKDIESNTLKNTQITNSKDELDKQITTKLAKLDAILKEKGIKLKKVEPSKEQLQIAQNKIEKIKKEFNELKDNK